MSSRPWGYRTGPVNLRTMKVDSDTAAAISAGDMLVPVTAGYVGQAAAGELPIYVAWGAAADPSADGGTEVEVLILTPDVVFEYPPDVGTVTQGLVGTTMDVGGAQTINIDASVDDIVIVRGVDIERNTLFVSITPTYLGVA